VWSDKWLGLPYAELGRGPAYDCLGLFLAVQREEFGRDLLDPLCHPRDGFALTDDHRVLWERAPKASAGCAVLFRWPAWWHIGVAINDRLMLHIETDLGGSQVVDFSHRRFGHRLEGIYSYVG